MPENTKHYIADIEDFMIFSKTDTKGIITAVNKNFCKISGYTKRELIGKKHNILKHPDMKRSEFDRLWASIESSKPYRIIFKNVSKKGEIFYLDSFVIPIYDEVGEIVGYSSFAYDLSKFFELNSQLINARKKITDVSRNFKQILSLHQKNLIRRNFDKELQKNFTQNEKASKKIHAESLSLSIKQTLANLAHQWRQPLNELGILLFNLKQKQAKAEFTELYERCKELIKQMSQSIDNFAEPFQKQHYTDSFSLLQTLDEVRAVNFELFENAGVVLKVNIKKDYEILGLREDLVRVFFHLFMNAIEAYGRTKSKEISIAATKFSKNYVKIEVADKAGGILFLDKIFQPFFTTKFPTQGTGLDLYFCKQIIENMQGRIKARNDKGGACFKIFLRLNKEMWIFFIKCANF